MAATGLQSSNYKLDLGGYKGPELTSNTITLRILRQAYAPETDALIKSWYDAFTTSYPNITVNEELVPYGNLHDKLLTYVASGSAPDIMMGRGDFIPAYVNSSVALPLDDYLTSEFINDILPRLKDQSSINGKLYGIPWQAEQQVFFFNRDLFK